MKDSNEELIAQLTPKVRRAVQRTSVLVNASGQVEEFAAKTIRNELEKFCDGEGAYGDALRAVADGTKPQGSAIALVIAECTKKIAVYVTTWLKNV